MHRYFSQFLKVGLIVGLILTTGINSNTAYSQSQPGQPKGITTSKSKGRGNPHRRKLDKSQLDFSKFGRPAAGSRAGGGSRTETLCNQKMVALVPAPDRPDQVLIAKTTSNRPTLWFYNPYVDNVIRTAELILSDEQDQEMKRYSVQLPRKAGIVGITLPSKDLSLIENQTYAWQLNLTCAHNPRTFMFPIMGRLQKVTNPRLIRSDDYGIDAENDLWHDALDTLARLRLDNPKDLALQDDWKVLLDAKGVKLGELSEKELVGVIQIESP
jgi:Domain of Unknown Function (DUF928)